MSTISEALISLREIIKQEHGIDVDVKVNIHNWHMTEHMGELVIKDMAGDRKAWETDSSTVDRVDYGDKQGSLTFIHLKGLGVNEGLGATIFKKSNEKFTRPAAVPKPSKKLNITARMIMLLQQQIRDLYGVEANIFIQARVEASNYRYLPSKNPGITTDKVSEMFSTIAFGTKWTQHNDVNWYSESSGTHIFELRGRNIEIEIRFPLKKEKS